jgi:hypothetical protein
MEHSRKVASSILIENLSDAPLVFHFFAFNGGTPHQNQGDYEKCSDPHTILPSA